MNVSMINHYQNVSGPALGIPVATKIRLNIKIGNNNFQSYLPKYYYEKKYEMN